MVGTVKTHLTPAVSHLTTFSKRLWIYVTKLAKTKKGLVLGKVSYIEDLEKLRELTETTADTIYNFNPTRQQFKKFVKEKGFSNEDFYIKID